MTDPRITAIAAKLSKHRQFELRYPGFGAQQDRTALIRMGLLDDTLRRTAAGEAILAHLDGQRVLSGYRDTERSTRRIVVIGLVLIVLLSGALAVIAGGRGHSTDMPGGFAPGNGAPSNG